MGARVYPGEQMNLDAGYDVRAWLAEGLLDYISPQDSMYADFSVPYAEWAALTRGSKCMLYPGLLPWTSFRARNRRGARTRR